MQKVRPERQYELTLQDFVYPPKIVVFIQEHWGDPSGVLQGDSGKPVGMLLC